VNICGVFQRLTESGWVDIEGSEYCKWSPYLFAWLGDVRNDGSEFSRVEPVASNRGLPDGFLVDDKGYHSEVLFMGDHSHSWALASELLESATCRVAQTGQILMEVFELWDRVSEPEVWVNVSDPGAVLGQRIELDEETTCVVVQWTVDVKAKISDFLSEVRQFTAAYGGDVRFVFGFSG